MKILLFSLSCILILFFNGCANNPATTTNYTASTAQEIEHLVKGQNYSFVAKMMQPMSGRNLFVNGNYTMNITQDKIQVNLPYIGRAYTAGYGENAGINFESSDFEYKAAKNNKNRWEVEINPKNNNTVKQLFITIYSDGNADLRVVPLNKQYISYTGYITANKQ